MPSDGLLHEGAGHKKLGCTGGTGSFLGPLAWGRTPAAADSA